MHLDDDDTLDPHLERLTAPLRAEPVVRPEARARLLAALAVEPRPRRARSGRWWTAPRLTLSPLGGLALAAGLAAVSVGATLLVTRGREPSAPTGVRLTAASQPGTAAVVRFSLAAPGARSVALVGDFNGWDPAATPLRVQEGEWTVTIPVQPGRHVYGFVVDGTTVVADPQAPRATDDDFGAPNSVLYVGGVS